MRVVLSLAILISATAVAFARDGTAAALPEDQNAPSVSLRALLNAYQSLYERQFHEPLPENQKALLATLPRFNGDSTYKARKSVEWTRSFQQDDTPRKVEEEPTKTTQIHKRDVTSEPSNETMSTTTASTPAESTTSEVTEVSTTVTEATLSEIQTTEAKEEPSTTIPTTNPTSETASTTSSGTVSNTSEISSVQRRKLAELHPEMKLPMEGKAKPIIVQEVQPSLKTGEVTVSADGVQPRATSNESPKIVLSQAVALMPVPPKEAVEVPKEEAEESQVEDTTKKSSTSSVPQGISLPLTKSETRKEVKLSVPVAKSGGPSIPPAGTLSTVAARTPEPVRKTVTANSVRVTKPALRQQNRVQQPSLKVVNHFVVPKAENPSTGSPLARRVTSQNRGSQPRRPQPSRRASTPLRATLDGGAQATTPANKPNIIVIRDGRIVPLTEQQQRDLETILSAMGALRNEVPIRRRAPPRKGRVVAHRPVSRQQSML